MRKVILISLTALWLSACGGGAPPAETAANEGGPAGDASSGDAGGEAAAGDPGSPDGENVFQLNDSTTAGSAHGASESKIKATATEAAMKFFIVDKDSNKPLVGYVIALSADGKKYYTQETDSAGYAEVLVPIGKKYELEYLSLGKRNISAQVPVPDKPNQNIKLTLRYKPYIPPPRPADEGGGDGVGSPPEPVFTLNGITFDTGKSTIKSESFPRLDSVVEYMTHKTSVRIEISGHTDNVGKASSNKKLSEDRAKSCRQYLVDKGIDGGRVEAVGFGDSKPVASNDTDEGRQRNRRIEAKELK